MSREQFMDKYASWLSDMKIRLSYGQAGNDNTSQFSYLTGYQINGGGYIIGPSINRSIQTTGLSNPLITWENITNYNAGLDLSLWNRKLTFEGNIFYRRREGILAQEQRALPSTFGATLPPVNLNTIDNRGFEAMVGYHPRVGNVKLSFTPTITVTKQKWVKRNEEDYTDPDQVRLYKLTGKSTNIENGYLSDGIFMSQAEISKLGFNQDQVGNSTLKPGDIRYVDLNGDGILDWRDQTEIGKGSFPEIVYSLIMGGSYKNFSVELLWQGASGFDFYVGGAAASMFSNESIPFDYQYQYRWKPDANDPTANSNPDAKLPASSLGLNNNNRIKSDFWLKDASFIRLRNVNISYDFNKNLLSKAGIKNVQVYLSGTNIFMINKLGIYKNTFDPDANVSGVGNNYPIHRNLSVGLRLSL